MTVKKSLICFIALVGVLAGSRAHAQIYTHAATPFEPGYFGHDLQFFAPGDFSEFGDQPELPIGWYFNYSRLWMHVSRPDVARNSFDSDEGWGNRYHLGYMTQDDVGLEVEVFNVNGPSSFSTPLTPINIAEYNSVELNRTYRLVSHGGGVFEPFLGVRWSTLADDSDPNKLGITQNNMLGGQIGFRYFKRKGRWTVSGGLKAYPAVNFQQFRAIDVSNTDFTLGSDARIEASYNVTRDISLVVGWEMVYHGMGIARASVLQAQDFIMTGATFGLEVNFR